MNLGQESEQVEFKKSTSETEEAIIDITAILNKFNSGILYFGVKNNGDICGMQIGEGTCRDISRKISEQIRPQIYPIISVEKSGSDNYIKVIFSGTLRPYSANGKYYIRVADESKDLSPMELVDLILKEGYSKWEKLPSQDTIEDIDNRLLENFHKKAIQCQRMPPIPYSKDELLTKLGLLTIDNYHLNNAGRLLFSKNEPIQLKQAVFATDEKLTFIDMTPIKGNIFSLLEKSEQYIKDHINWRAEIKGFEREEIPEVPVEAIREILVNSFAHANYLSLSKHEIDIHPGRIAIFNPGAFPDGLTPDDYVEKNISSKIRNELICDALFRCHAVESWSTGLRKTYQLCKKDAVPLGYEKEDDGFWFFFYRSHNTTKVVTVVQRKPLTEFEQVILFELKENPEITKVSLAQKTKRNARQVQRALDILKENGYIARIGSNRSGHWKILK